MAGSGEAALPFLWKHLLKQGHVSAWLSDGRFLTPPEAWTLLLQASWGRKHIMSSLTGWPGSPHDPTAAPFPCLTSEPERKLQILGAPSQPHTCLLVSVGEQKGNCILFYL